MIRVSVNLRPRQRNDFVEATTRIARQSARLELERLGEAWVEEVTSIVQRELPRRDGSRHKRNTTHLENSFQYRIVEGPNDGFPMRLELTTKPGVNAKKIAALEYGVPGTHQIKARRTQYLRWGDAPGDLHRPFTKEVTWKPDGPNSHGKIAGGYGFMRRARDRVLRQSRARRR